MLYLADTEENASGQRTDSQTGHSYYKGLIAQLEPRLMYDGAAGVAAADVVDGDSAGDEAAEQPQADGQETDTGESSSDKSAADSGEDGDSSSAVTPADVVQALQDSERREVAFISSDIVDAESLIQGLSSDVEVIELAAGDDLGVIAETLSAYADLDAIHIFTHGSSGAWVVGSDTLQADTLSEYAESLQAIGGALGEGGDLLLYGCDLASDEDGAALVQGLAEWIGADVAASDDPTGASDLGGDWDLESTTGEIETAVAVTEEGQTGYSYVMTGLTYADLNNWTEEGDSNAEWEIEAGGRTVVQHYNGSSMFFLSPEEDVIDRAIQGTLLQSDVGHPRGDGRGRRLPRLYRRRRHGPGRNLHEGRLWPEQGLYRILLDLEEPRPSPAWKTSGTL